MPNIGKCVSYKTRSQLEVPLLEEVMKKRRMVLQALAGSKRTKVTSLLKCFMDLKTFLFFKCLEFN